MSLAVFLTTEEGPGKGHKNTHKVSEKTQRKMMISDKMIKEEWKGEECMTDHREGADPEGGRSEWSSAGLSLIVSWFITSKIGFSTNSPDFSVWKW